MATVNDRLAALLRESSMLTRTPTEFAPRNMQEAVSSLKAEEKGVEAVTSAMATEFRDLPFDRPRGYREPPSLKTQDERDAATLDADADIFDQSGVVSVTVEEPDHKVMDYDLWIPDPPNAVADRILEYGKDIASQMFKMGDAALQRGQEIKQDYYQNGNAALEHSEALAKEALNDINSLKDIDLIIRRLRSFSA